MEIDKVRRRWDVSFDRMKDRAINLKEDNARIKDEAFAKDTALDMQKRKITLLNEQIVKMKGEKTVTGHLVTGLKYAAPSATLAGLVTLFLKDKVELGPIELQSLTAGLTVVVNMVIIILKKLAEKKGWL